MRLLVLCFLIYLGYWIFKKWALPEKSSKSTPEQKGLAMVDDVMLKDPFCQAYFPKKNGVKSVIDGEICYFCSTRCRDKYLKTIKDSKHGVME
jgi:YHS domain-containing protein